MSDLFFKTHSQEMTVVDTNTKQCVSAWSLKANKLYEVFIVVENSSSTEQDVEIQIWHTALGIAVGGTYSQTAGIQNPCLDISVPPKGPGGNGEFTTSFKFQAPNTQNAQIHLCFYASLRLKSAPDQEIERIQQNADTWPATVVGQPYTNGFLLFGGMNPETVYFEVGETLESGAQVPATDSWKPKLIPPQGLSFGPGSAAGSVSLQLPGNNPIYIMGLEVTVLANATKSHVFHITGKANGLASSVDIRIEPPAVQPTNVAPDPYFAEHFSWCSSQIILIDPSNNQEVLVGGTPGSPGNTQLNRNVKYRWGVRIHNDSSTPAYNTHVMFFDSQHGVSSLTQALDVVVCDVPVGPGCWEFFANVPFIPSQDMHNPHKCAVVRLHNQQAPWASENFDGNSPFEDPQRPGHSYCLWRNTDSIWVFVMKPWNINLGVLWPMHIPKPPPVEIEVAAQHVPSGWQNHGNPKKMLDVLEKAGTQPRTPLFLMAELRCTLKPIDLKAKIEAAPGTKLEQMDWSHLSVMSLPSDTILKAARIHAPHNAPGNFTITGTIPREAVPGDIILLQTTAHYPKVGEIKARSVQFLHVLHVAKS